MTSPHRQAPRPPVRPLDEFVGSDRLRRLSERLMDWYQDEPTDDDIREALGETALPAFRYAQERLRGRVRRVTLEPAFCHSADVALRARELGYGPHMVTVCLLHDVVEDASRTIADAPALLDEIEARFSAAVARDVCLLTNRYSLLFKAIRPKVRRDLPFDRRAIAAHRAALDVVRHELAPAIADRFLGEFARLGRFLDERAELASWARIAARDRRFTVQDALSRQLYGLYAEELVGSVEARVTGEEAGVPDSALVAKFLDLTDNVRTTELSGRLPMYKLLNKAETVLDETIVRVITAAPFLARCPDSTVPEQVPLLACRIVDQLEARRRAVLQNFAETRFVGLVEFLGSHVDRLSEKYAIPPDRMREIREREDAVRRHNGVE